MPATVLIRQDYYFDLPLDPAEQAARNLATGAVREQDVELAVEHLLLEQHEGDVKRDQPDVADQAGQGGAECGA